MTKDIRRAVQTRMAISGPVSRSQSAAHVFTAEPTVTPEAGHDGQTAKEREAHREAHREWLAWCDGRHAAEMGNGNPYRRGSKQDAAWERGAHHTVALHVLAFITDLYR